MLIRFCNPTKGCPDDISRLPFLMEDYDGQCWFTDYDDRNRTFRGIAIDKNLSPFRQALALIHEVGHVVLHLFYPRLPRKSFTRLHYRYDKIMDYLNL